MWSVELTELDLITSRSELLHDVATRVHGQHLVPRAVSDEELGMSPVDIRLHKTGRIRGDSRNDITIRQPQGKRI